MKLVSGWKTIRISQEVYRDVQYRRKQMVEDTYIPSGVLLEYAYLKFLFTKHPEVLENDAYSKESKRLHQIERIYGLDEEKF